MPLFLFTFSYDYTELLAGINLTEEVFAGT
jgi:hypothetical protein